MEGAVCGLDVQPSVEHDERLAHGHHDALRVVAGLLRPLLAAFDRIHVAERDHGSVDLVVERLVGPDAERVPVPVAVLDFAFLDGEGVHHLL